jgi:hypothetical protein
VTISSSRRGETKLVNRASASGRGRALKRRVTHLSSWRWAFYNARLAFN